MPYHGIGLTLGGRCKATVVLQTAEMVLVSDFLPQKLTTKLMKFQIDGITRAINNSGRCLIGDEMGLGKTLQAISVAYYYKHEWPLLIIVPSSLRYPWIEELERWFPDIHPHDINLIQGGADISGISSSSITVVTYGLLRHPASKVVREALCNQNFKIIIVDESHYLKNRKSATSKYLVPLIQKSQRKLLLTGTPALARPEELFPQLSALMPKEFSRFGPFADRYCDAHYQYIGKMKRWMTDGASNLEELQNLLTSKIMIRRLKKDVLTQLPPKQRQRIPFDIKESDLKKDLDSTWNDLGSALDKNKMPLAKVLENSNEESSSSTWFEIRKNMSRLYQKTCFVKLGPVKEYVKMLCENRGLKFIIFAYHHVMMDSLSEQLCDDNIKFIRIDGATIQQDRPRLVHQYQVDRETRVAILSIKAAGVGLTLTAGKLVVFAELDWTPGAMEQCEDRAHRIGQRDTVHVHYLVAKSTLDDWVWAALARKTSVVTTTLNGKTQVLEMEEGNKGQIDCLTNADAYKPPENSHQDIVDFFKSQQPKDQMTMLDFFTPKGSKKKETKVKGISPIVIDSAESANTSLNEFVTPKGQRKKRSDLVSDSTTAQSFSLVKRATDMKKKFVAKEVKKTEKFLSQCNKDLMLEINNTPSRKNVSSIDKGLIKKSNIEATVLLAENKNEIFELSQPPESQGNDLPLGENHGGETIKLKKMQSLKDVAEDRNLCSKTDLFISRNSPNEGSIESTGYTPNNTIGANAVSETWNCAACTFINHEDLPFCEICSTPKPRSKRKVNKKTRFSPVSMISNLSDNPSLSMTLDAGSKDDQKAQKQEKSEIFKTLEYGSDIDLFDSNSNTPYNSDCNDLNMSVDSSTKGKNNADSSMVVSSQGNVSGLFTTSDNQIDSDEDLPDIIVPKRQRHKTQDMTDVEASSHKQLNDKNTEKSLNNINSTVSSPSLSATESQLELTPQKYKNESQSSQETVLVQTTPSQTNSIVSIESVIAEETAAAKLLFSPKNKKKIDGMGDSFQNLVQWVCEQCDTLNDGDVDDCDGCLASKPKQENKEKLGVVEQRRVNLDEVTVHNLLKFCSSQNTNRIYLYDQDNTPLHLNFVPLDVEVGNYSEFPDLLLHPNNLKLVQRFVREWNSLSATKRRLVIRSGEIFTSPCAEYEEIRQKSKQPTNQRLLTKESVSAAAQAKAKEIGGSVRQINRPIKSPKQKRKRVNEKDESVRHADKDLNENISVMESSSSDNTIMDKLKGVSQVLDNSGNPLCVFCHKKYETELLTGLTVQENPWHTRFCSRTCMHQYWVRSSREYAVDQVFSEEHGVCQICHFQAHQFFLRIKNTSDVRKRAKLLKESKYNILTSDFKEKMVKKPSRGLFWEVDHINPVSLGGGQCDIDNLRTLCTPCHREVTAQQNKDRAKRRRLEKAAACGDITAFFKAQ